MAAPWFSRARNVVGKGARNLFGPTQNNNTNRARQTALKQALSVYAQSSNYKSYITAARTLNSLLANVPRNNREYTKGLGVLRVTTGTTPGNIRRKINERLGLNRRNFLKNALINKNVTNKNLTNVFGPNVNLSYRLYTSRFQTNLASARTIQNLNKLEANIPRNHPNANNYRSRISNKRNQLKPPPNIVSPPPPNIVKPPPSGNNGNGNRGGSSTVTGIGKLKIQIGTGNSNLRKRLENLERVSKEAANAKVIAKKANANANARPNNANAARVNANAARRELEAMRKELEALTAAKAAAEAEKVNLQARVNAAEAAGAANVNSLRGQLSNAKAAAEKMESNFKGKFEEVTADAQQARMNANAAKAKAAKAANAARASNATAAEHLAAKTAAERAASEAQQAAETAKLAQQASNSRLKIARNAQLILAKNKLASIKERNAAIARVRNAEAAVMNAQKIANAAEAARREANARANAVKENAERRIAAANENKKRFTTNESQYSSTGLVRGVAPNVTNTSRGKYPPSGLKPYRNRYNSAMANQNVGSKKQLLLKLQENLLSFTPNNTTRNNKRQLSLNIRNAISGLETLGEQTSRYTAFALGESTRTKHSNRNRAGFNKWIASMNRGITRGNTDTQSRLNRLKQQAQRNRNASRITNQNLKNILEEHARLTKRFQNKQAEISLGQL